MEQKDLMIENFRSLNPQGFSYVEKLELFPEVSEDSGTSLTLVIEFLSDISEAQNLHISFYGVKDLQMHIALDYIQFQELQILSIKEYQWENLRYKVVSGDANRLIFFCRSFMAKLIGKEG